MNFLSRSNPEILFVCARYGGLAINPSLSNVAKSCVKYGVLVWASAEALSLYLFAPSVST